jgi:hypothetical protein
MIPVDLGNVENHYETFFLSKEVGCLNFLETELHVSLEKV